MSSFPRFPTPLAAAHARRRVILAGHVLALTGVFLSSRPAAVWPYFLCEGLGALLALIGAWSARASDGRVPWPLRIVGIAVAASVPVFLRNDRFSLFAAAAVVWLFCGTRTQSPGNRWTAVVTSLFVLTRSTPAWPPAAQLMRGIDDAARLVIQAVSLARVDVRPGAQYLRLDWPFVIAASCFWVTPWRRALRTGAGFLLVFAGIAWLAYHGMAWALDDLTSLAAFAPVTTGIAAIPALLIMRRWLQPGDPRGTVSAVAFAFTLCAAAAAPTLIALAEMRWARAEPGPLRIGWVGQGLQDQVVAQHGSYGAYSQGMFGDIGNYVAEAGASLKIVEASAIASLDGSGLDAVFFANFNGEMGAAEKRAVEEFVARGRTCVVLCDHTDVGGLRDPTNRLLDGHGIRVNFDSAKAVAAWERAFSLPGTGWLLQAERRGAFPYGVGASLSTASGARPLLSLDLGFSDGGAPWNYVGAYLGNYAVDRGEDVGGIVLVAEAEHGQGRFVVFGDTSPFQNAGLHTSAARFLPRFLSSLRPDASGSPLVPLLILGVVLAATALRFSLVAPWLILAATGAHFVASQVTVAHSLAPRRPLSAVAFVSLPPHDVPPERPMWKSISSLISSARRAGYLTHHVTRVVDAIDLHPEAICIAMPLAKLDDQPALREFVSRGGGLVAIGGPEHLWALADTLDALGAVVDPACRGLLPSQERAAGLQAPRFPSAYAIHSPRAEGACIPLVREGEDIVVAECAMGSGRVILIADDAWPYGNNIEGDAAWHPGNIAFLDRLWSRLSDARSGR